MSIFGNIYSRGFDHLYYALRKKKTCSYIKEHDLFDGKEYSIDGFYKEYEKYFFEPQLFYTDFGGVDKYTFLCGEHFNKRYDKVLKDAVYEKMLFKSPVTTGYPETDIVPFKWFRGDEKSKTLMIFAPGWGRGNQVIEEHFCEILRQSGIDSALMTVPYQQARTPEKSYTGEYFISANVFWTISNFRHFVAEIRLLIQYMRKYYDRIGLIGMSSGGFITGLTAMVEEVDYLISFITGCQVGKITWNGLITREVKKDLIRKGVTESALSKVWSISDQCCFSGCSTAKYYKHYVALYDDVIPTEYQLKLWDYYGRQDIMRLESGHYSVVFSLKKVATDVVRFIKKCSGV